MANIEKREINIENLIVESAAMSFWDDYWKWLEDWIRHHFPSISISPPTPDEVKEAYGFLNKISRDPDDSKRLVEALSNRDIAKVGPELETMVKKAGYRYESSPSIAAIVAAAVALAAAIYDHFKK